MVKEGVKKIVSSKNKTFLAFCFSFMLGAVLASWLSLPTLFYFSHFRIAGVLVLIGGIFLIVVLLFRRRPFFRFALLLVFFFLFGAGRLLAIVPDCQDPGAACHYNGKTVTIAGWVAAYPDERADKTNYYIQTKQINGAAAQGLILVQAKPYQKFSYGDNVLVHCKLQQPKNFGDSTFRYDKYLADQGVWSLCSFPTITAATPEWHLSPFLLQPIFKVKDIVAFRIGLLWPQAQGSFMAGLLYGSKSGLPQAIMDNFSKTGITHIIAVSGFNITIIATAIMSLLFAGGLWRQQAFWGVLVGVWIFTIFSGLSASAVRAAIMGSLVLVAEQLGHQSRIGTSIVATAALMTFLSPFVFLWDAGFQLSFLATLGLVYMSPILEKGMEIKRISNLRNSKFFNFIWSLLIPTLSAIILTSPLILYQFGRLSFVAPLVNLLVLWSIPWLMLGGAAALSVSFFFWPLSRLVAVVTGFGLQYVILIADFFGGQSWSAVSFQLPWWGMVLAYALLFFFIARSRRRMALQRDAA